ncbi:SusC/RagA family TonB-linked outer membrane protein [Paucihalobacter sp.]|uniref:SusC/RagA family TonB-linked outer membrane protein n=1 Tax=Paucihalobacter sp. TaxID=2850405 RepID=UPI002FDFC62A
MKLKLTWLLTLFMAFVMQFSFSQEKTITGTVTGADDGFPLPGVNVIVKGTQRGTQTDFDGNFSIRANTGDILVFSFVGYETAESPVGTSNTINVSMNTGNVLEEVIITGYATQTRAKSSVSSVRISAETIENRPNASFVQTLSGQVPGLNITTNTGQPGANSIVRLRGISSINGDTEPLFIIDGVPVDQDNFRSLNPQDIASIDVLKDAGATSIYGNRGANGVIVITTRKGSFNQGLKVNYNGFISFSTMQDNDYNRMSSQELLRYERTRGNGAGAGNSTSLFNPGAGQPMTDAQIDAAPNFDWLDFFFSTGVTENHNLSLTSGGENSSQFTSFGYSDTDGILIESDLKRFNFRSNVSGKSKNNKFNYNTNVTLNYSKSNEPTAIGTGGINRNFVLGGFQGVPYLTADDYTNGAALLSPLSFTNTPLLLLDLARTHTRFEEELRFVGGLTASYALTDHLTANVNLGGDYQGITFTRAEGPASFNALLFGGAANPTSGFQDQQSTRIFTYNQVTSLNFTKTFWDKHTIDVSVYSEYFKAHRRGFGFRQNGLNPKTFFPGDGAGFIGDVAANDLFVDTVNASIRNAGLFSYFGKIGYDYDERYGIEGVYRRDASSRFAGSNRWATFWSVSGRWNISNEKFMEGSKINNLKLRGSYGTAGNQDITGGGLFSALDNSFDFFATGVGYAGLNSQFVQLNPNLNEPFDGRPLAIIGDRNLRWEEIATANIGIDFGVWNSRFRGSIDVYERVTNDLYQSAPVSPTVGITGSFLNTVIEMTNRGVDFDLRYDLIQAKTDRGLRVEIGVLGNYNENELNNLPGNGELIGTGRNGGPLDEYFTLRYAGVNPANGELLYYTANGDLTETPNANTDRVWLGKNIYPDWNGSLNLNVDYKGFFLQTQWNYVVGVDRFDNDYAGAINPDNVGQFTASTDILRAWQQPGDITDIPSWTASNRNSFVDSDRFLRNADFLRLRFASFGYTFSAKQLENTGLNFARIFFNGENVFTFSEWRGFDPEAQTNISRQFPTPRTLSVGFELGF